MSEANHFRDGRWWVYNSVSLHAPLHERGEPSSRLPKIVSSCEVSIHAPLHERGEPVPYTIPHSGCVSIHAPLHERGELFIGGENRFELCNTFQSTHHFMSEANYLSVARIYLIYVTRFNPRPTS